MFAKSTDQAFHGLFLRSAGRGIDLINAIEWLRFTRSGYISVEQIERLLEAGRWALSSGNGQLWRSAVFDYRVPEAWGKARCTLDPDNQLWAARAPVLVLAGAQEIRANGKSNSKAWHDLYPAKDNLLIQAIGLGLHCRLMGGFDQALALRLYPIPEGLLTMVMIAVGHPVNVEDLPRRSQKKKLDHKHVNPFRISLSAGIGTRDSGESLMEDPS